MVVVSGNWWEQVGKYPPLIISSDVVVNQSEVEEEEERTMAAKAILTCRPNSHPFQERTLLLDQPVKVGRSVARVKATHTNAVFDCKVLSRNHAMLWYKDGKFYLQDTKSSNGTFVNNNKLTAETENHELSSGDIVQFGVDVVESRKVTHGCIVASIKLYLPDGKEAKASPSIGDGDRHGVVPLDELYKLNQILQEANQREQCLETKLSELQNAVIETRKAAEESWYVYVGEERLLSRISALETQLQHVSKNWGEDKLRMELLKAQEENEAYQVAAKQALEKLHGEKLEAVALAMEKERARFAAEQEAQLAKEQFGQIQLEFELIARRLSEQQEEAEKQKKLELIKREEAEREWNSDEQNANLQLQLHSINNTLSITDFDPNNLDEEKNQIIYNDDIIKKEGLLAENEECESLNNSNGSHICLTVGPVEETKSIKEESLESGKIPEPKRIRFTVTKTIEEEKHESHESSDESKNDRNESEKDDIDSKTLKYQFAQNENMKQRIESLKSIANANKSIITELRKNLDKEKEISSECRAENTRLMEDFELLQQKFKESLMENRKCQEKITLLTEELDRGTSQQVQVSNGGLMSAEHLLNLEEELVVIKERFAQVSEEKLEMRRDLLHLTEQYNLACSRSYNKYFFYVAPLVIMVLYLLVSAMIS